MKTKPKPKVVYVLPSYDLDTGSHFFHLYEFLEEAAKELDLFVVIEKCRHSPAAPQLRHYCQKFSWPLARFFEIVFALASFRLRGYKNFYVHYSFFGALASWAVTIIFGGNAYYWNSGMPWLYRRPWLEERVFRFILRSTILVTDPQSLADEYIRHYGLKSDHIRIIPHFISVSRFQDPAITRESARRELGIPLGAKVILFVHRLSRRKGAHLLPEIISGVTKLHKDVMFVIVGDGPERENIELRIKNQGLGRYVRFAGEVPQRDIAPYFRAADFFLLPSEEEGFPHVLLEAMAAGLPYVATDVGGVRELTPPELLPYIAAAGKPGQFVRSVCDILALPADALARVAVAERQWVKRYDLDTVAAEFAKLFVLGVGLSSKLKIFYYRHKWKLLKALFIVALALVLTYYVSRKTYHELVIPRNERGENISARISDEELEDKVNVLLKVPLRHFSREICYKNRNRITANGMEIGRELYQESDAGTTNIYVDYPGGHSEKLFTVQRSEKECKPVNIHDLSGATTTANYVTAASIEIRSDTPASGSIAMNADTIDSRFYTHLTLLSQMSVFIFGLLGIGSFFVLTISILEFIFKDQFPFR